MGWFDELQRMSTSTENAVSSRLARQEVDITELLPSIRAPTLVLHARGDQATPFDDAVLSASLIPNARLVPLQAKNHILLADEPAWAVFVAQVRRFMAGAVGPTPSAAPGLDDLSAREEEVLRLAAEGRGNAEIAESLGLSVRTIERHLSNAYLKLGITGRAARTAAVASLLRRDGA